MSTSTNSPQQKLTFEETERLTRSDYGAGALRHFVAFQFKPEVSEATIQEVCDRVLRLGEDCRREGRRYIRSIEAGYANSFEGADQGKTFAFLMTFDSEGDRNYYVGSPLVDPAFHALYDPAHEEFKGFVRPLLNEGGAFVFDFTVLPGSFDLGDPHSVSLPAPKHDWRFNEASGTTAADAMSSGKIDLDRASWVSDRPGNALRFDPKDGVRHATTGLSDLPPPWTAALWVKRTADSVGASLFSSKKYALKLEQWPSTHEVGITKLGEFDETFGYAAPLNEWVHLTLVGTSTETTLYVNGKRQGSINKSIDLGLYWLGSNQSYTEFASALFDEVKVFDQALAEAQVAKLANGSF